MGNSFPGPRKEDEFVETGAKAVTIYSVETGRFGLILYKLNRSKELREGIKNGW
jgi:hypothetical protein